MDGRVSSEKGEGCVNHLLGLGISFDWDYGLQLLVVGVSAEILPFKY